jgi:hypothetical protein
MDTSGEHFVPESERAFVTEFAADAYAHAHLAGMSSDEEYVELSSQEERDLLTEEMLESYSTDSAEDDHKSRKKKGKGKGKGKGKRSTPKKDDK